MSRSLWSCATPDCRDPETGKRPVLGVVRKSGSLTLAPAFVLALLERRAGYHVDLRAGHAVLSCPVCRRGRRYKVGAIHLGLPLAEIVVLEARRAVQTIVAPAAIAGDDGAGPPVGEPAAGATAAALAS